MHRGIIYRLGAIAALSAGLALAVACGGDGVSQSDYDKVKAELQDKEQANQKLQQDLTDAQKKAAATPSGQTAAAAPKALIAAVSVTPAPTPTPVPAGTTPAPAPARETPPPAMYEKVGDFYVYAETLVTTTASKYNVAATISCTPSGAFQRGQRIVFRYEIVDMKSGKRVTDQDVTSVKVVLPNGEESAGRFSQRGGGRVPGAPFMFSSNWDIPLDYPLGGIDYKIVLAAKDGRTFTWKPPALVAEGGNDTRPKVVQ